MSQLSILSVAATPSVPTTFATDSGDAVPVANTLQVEGANGITTSGAGDTVTITAPDQDYVTDSGTATSVGNSINIVGGTGVMTSAVGDTVTIDVESGVSLSFPTDNGTATPAANEVDIVGISGITTTGAGNIVTIDNLRDLSAYVVSASGDSEYTTISDAITQAVADGATDSNRATIYVKPGSYNEDLTLAPGIDLVGAAGRDAAKFYQTLNPDNGSEILVQLTGGVVGPASGSASIAYFYVNPDTDIFCIDGTTGTTHVYSCVLNNNRTLQGCVLASGGNVFCFRTYFYVVFPSAYSVFMDDAFSVVVVDNCFCYAGSNGNMAISDGFLTVYGGSYQGGIALSGGTAYVYEAYINAQNTGGGAIHVTGGALEASGCIFNSTLGGITGNAGTVDFSGCFNNAPAPALSTSYSGTVTQNGFSAGNISWFGGWTIRPTIVSSYPYTMLITDSYISAGGTGARTINLFPNASSLLNVGQTVVIKDAAANSLSSGAITIDGNTANIIGTTTASTYVLNQDGASVNLTYNGTAWEVW